MSEYVAKIHKKEPKKCWPFGSLGDLDNHEVFASYQSAESTSGTNNNMCKTVYNGSSEETSSIVNTTQCQYEKSVNEDARVVTSVLADNTEPEGKQMRKKPQKYRLLSDIYKDPASVLRVRRDITNPENLNTKFNAETEDENDDISLQEFFRKQKDVEITPSSKKRRKMIQDEKSKLGSQDSNGNDSVISLRIRSRKEPRIDDIDTQTIAKCIKVRSLSPIVLSEKKGGPSSLDCEENTKHKDCRLPCHQKMNKHAEFSNAQATEKTSEDSEMEVVMLLARHFNKENPSTNEQTEMLCACVQKMIGEFSTPFTNKSVYTKTSSKTAVAYADTCNRIIKEKLEKAICSAQVDDHSKLALKSKTASMFQSKLENCVLKAARNVENCSTLVCSLNRNPADFCKPNARSKFMRGG